MAKRGTFAFELSKPSKKGTLMKQGAWHTAFKYRYFVLYPGFLVYYDSENKWKVDIAKGETLGNRIGAIKLKNGTVSVAKDAPRGCKFGLVVHAPDPVNKRQSYLLNALNKGDRDEWISAVKKAIPGSKGTKNDVKVPEQKLASYRPAPVVRQDTAAAAALLGSGEGGEDETETSIDSHIAVGPSGNESDTAGAATPPDLQETTMEDDTITSLNDEVITKALGNKENGRNDSSDEEQGSDIDLSKSPPPITNGHATPTSEGLPSVQDEVPLDSERKVESSMNIEGKVEVVTSVKVQTSNGEHKEGEGEGEGEEGGEKTRRTSEVAIAENKSALTVTLVRDNTVDVQEDSGTDSDDEELPSPAPTSDEPPHPPTTPPTDEPPTADSPTTPASKEPPTPTTPPSEEPPTPTTPPSEEPPTPTTPPSEEPPTPTTPPSEEPPTPTTPPSEEPPTPTTPPSEEPPTQNTSTPPPDPQTPVTPSIKIVKVPTLHRSHVTECSESDTMSREEEEAMVLKAKDKKRKTSAPFIEKKGCLYKEGGQRKTWKLRYFVLQPGMFTYYKNSTSTKPLGEVKLKNLQIRYPGLGERKQSFQFTVHTESSWNKRNDYIMAAQNDAEMKAWVAAFKLAGQKNTTPNPSPPGSDEDTPTS